MKSHANHAGLFFYIFIVALFCGVSQKTAAAAEEGLKKPVVTPAKLEEMRKAAAHKQRRIIFNNDGDDAMFSGESKTLIEEFLKKRTTPLLGSQVDTIFYSTAQSFGYFIHRTKVGEIFMTRKFPVEGQLRDNAFSDLIALGTDPLQLMVEFCRKNNLEIFWSYRMNDPHDSYRTDYSPFFFPKLKKDHPEYLVGSKAKKPPYGNWTAMDYTQPEVRDLAFKYFEEVCQNYDVDGIELDYFRDAIFFKSVAWGGQASQAELDMMTDLVRQIRKMTQAEGIKKGKPILLSIRVPDSVEYCRAIGLDMEKWLAEGLVDMLTVTCLFQLNPWEYSVRLGHKYDVPVYAGLSDSRVRAGMAKGWPQDFQRNTTLFYHGYAMQAWQSGVDGIYMFNYFNPNAPAWRELGDPKELQIKNKVYFMSPRGYGLPSAGSYVKGGEKFRNTPTLCVEKPIYLLSNQTQKMTLVMAENFPGAEKRKLRPEITCHLWVKSMAEGNRVDVKMNGRLLENIKASGESLDYRIEPADVKNGDNVFELTARAAPRKEFSGNPGAMEIKDWDMAYVCDKVLVHPAQLPWRRLMNFDGIEQIQGNQLLLADRGTDTADMINLAYPWHILPEALTVVEARVRVVDSNDPLGVCIRVANSAAAEYLTLSKDRIDLYFAKISCPLDTTKDMHTYRIVLKGKDIRVYVDGTLKLDGAGKFTTAAFDRKEGVENILDTDWNKNSLLFGSATGPGTGEAYWEYMKYYTEDKPVVLQDFIVAVTYLAPQAKP
ncbi:MAG: family 10 glycosylhydrolase [Kiritimatiellaeota bacterium]|nr:family 10 glycosylhydrolase [Kiritimatiellota bacterium]